MPLQALADRTVDQDVLDGRAPSVGALFRSRVRATPEAPAYLHFAEGSSELTTLSWAQTHEIVEQWAAGLISLGVQLEDRVAIASTTRVEWILADLAVICAGGATTTVYPTTIAEDVAYILADSGSGIVFAENEEQVAKLQRVRSEVPGVRQVIALTGPGSDDGWVITTDELAERGREWLAATPDIVDSRIDQLGPESLAVVIYTSGTTGRPKGVRLVQDSVVYEGAVIDAIGTFTRDDLQFLWLPLSHVFGKMLLATGLQIGFPTAVDGRVDKIVENLAIVKPTFMAGPPRIFEKAHGRIALMFAGETRRQEAALRLGPQGRRRDARRAGPRARQPSPGLQRRHGLATSSCCTRSATASAAGSVSSSPARRPLNARRRASGSAAVGLLDPRGLRPDRDLVGHDRQRPRPRLVPVRLRRLAPPGHRGAHRRGGRRDPCQGTGRHARLPQQRRGDRRGADRRRLVPHRRHRRASTSAASSTSPTGRRTSSRPRAASTSRPPRSRRGSRPCARSPASSSCTAPGATTRRLLVTLDPDALAGWAPTVGLAGEAVCRDSGLAAGPRAGPGATSTSSTTASTAGRRSRSSRSSTTT